MKRIIAMLTIVAALGVSHVALADVTIEMTHDGETQLLLVSETAIAAGTPEGKMIFDGKKEIMWVINEKEGTYQEITKKDLEKINEQMGDAKAQMEEKLKDLPPEQRAMVEKMMSGESMPGMPEMEVKRTVKALGQSKKVNDFKTSGYEVYENGVLVEEVWSASPGALDLGPEDFGAFKLMAEFMSTAAPGMEDFMGRFAKDMTETEEGEVPGFPVLTIEKNEGGEEIGRSELVRAEKGEIDPTSFELPDGLEKQKIEFGP